MAIVNVETLEQLLSSCVSLLRLSLESCQLNNNICRLAVSDTLHPCYLLTFVLNFVKYIVNYSARHLVMAAVFCQYFTDLFNFLALIM